MKDKLKSFAVSAKEIGAVLLRPNHARKKLKSLKQGLLDTAKSLDAVSDKNSRLEAENRNIREQVYALKAWIRAAHRLDKKPITETIKAALAHEKSA